MSSPIQLSDHAIERYRSRLCPQLSKSQARKRLLSQLPRLDWFDRAPDWIAETPSSLNTVAYLVDGTRYALPLRANRHKSGLIAPTCLTPDLPRPNHLWVEAEQILAIRSLLKLSGGRVVAPWRSINHLPSPAVARNDLYRRACLGRLGESPGDQLCGEFFLWLPGGAVLALNRRPGGMRASSLTIHQDSINGDGSVIAELRQIAKSL